MVELKDVCLSYPLARKGKALAVQGANASFAAGSFSSIIGPSGCGKTTIVKAIAGLISPNAGRVFLGGNPLNGINRKTAVIFQEYCLLPWKTVIANAELPLRIKSDKKPDRKKVETMLEEFGLASFAKRYPHQLSGGMKQRLAIVRALVAEPEVLLMDEPFSSLDALTREDAQAFLLSVQKERRLTVIMVTHSIEEAVYLSDTVYVMKGASPGTISRKITITREGGSSPDRSRGDPLFYEYSGILRQALSKPNLPKAALSNLQKQNGSPV